MFRFKEGGRWRVAERMGFVRTESLGRDGFSRSAERVSRRRRPGTLGRRGGAGRRNPIDDGGGDGVESATLAECGGTLGGCDVDGIIGSGEGGRCGAGGEGGFDAVDDDGSISGNFLNLKAI